MGKKYDYPTIVIGAGAGGLVIAIGLAKAGKRVLLIEKGNFGGDCTNFGCIPSKALIAAAHAAYAAKSLSHYGIEASLSWQSAKGALQRTRKIVAAVREHEEPAALSKHGVDTLTGTASFTGPHAIEVRFENGSQATVTAENIVIATGSSPRIPSLKGLAECKYLTNETIFALEEIPAHLAVIGGGPIGCELAQAFQRLGSRVSLIQHAPHLLEKEEPEAQSLLEQRLRLEGIDLHLGCEPLEAKPHEDGIALTFADKLSGEVQELSCDQLLVSAGRKPNCEGLGLSALGIGANQSGIVVDSYGRTALPHIWAVGDVAGYALFTHLAENEARGVLTNLLLPRLFKRKLDRRQPIPRVTYTDPEIAAIGLSEREAQEIYGQHKIAVYSVPFTALDRAITAGREEGFVKIITKKWSSRILGATIAAPRAGEMLPQIATAMRSKIPLRHLAGLIHPYPTYSLAIRKAADQWLTQTVIPTFKRWL